VVEIFAFLELEQISVDFENYHFSKVSSCRVKMTYVLLIFNYHKSIPKNCKTVDKILFVKLMSFCYIGVEKK